MWRLLVEGFRQFERLEVPDATGLNLIVGDNGVGKTSILEAVALLGARGDLSVIRSIASNRGELISDSGSVLFDDWFNGFQLLPDSALSIVAESTAHRRSALSIEVSDGASGPELRLNWEGSWSQHGVSSTFRLDWGSRGPVTGFLKRGPVSEQPRTRFINPFGFTEAAIQGVYGDVALTDEEEILIELLRVVEPRLSRVAARPNGVFVRLDGIKTPVSIRRMGGGFCRLLGLGAALATSREGILVVDEIDSGLHYSIQARVWNALAAMAKVSKTAVYASTHSLDCVAALASAIRDGVAGDPRLIRIERGNVEAVCLGPEEIVAAVEREVEIR
jgi:hypothetical protein